ncbi:pyridoxamine 5'-phosphate oxidase [Frankia sp. CcI49]|uniref:pyridoxamine 5'-phosphate oxidase family protein n=1 Tax=Frankia sp. CcI49 TaxID=1745382 RepID=UPI0006CA4424|nr:pyridoxamine 5'-phosphate oxidase family protein [Frankia sp. CcI49]KPM54995.1 pyridoxamine 5'-phosphate oxidase [Frankia sp. R43]ONH56148.1 pyridoxamine 5'-phosphate oxidase [Frankia sp. CcI49]
MTVDLSGRGAAFLEFWRERHLCSLTTVRPDGTAHVVPVGVTLEPAAGLARVITFRRSRKVALINGRDGVTAGEHFAEARPAAAPFRDDPDAFDGELSEIKARGGVHADSGNESGRDASRPRSAPGVPVAVCQIDGPRWSTLEGLAVVRDDPAAVAEAVRRYAERYRAPRVNPERVVLEISITRVLGTL